MRAVDATAALEQCSMERNALSIEEFCKRNGISRATFYNLVKRGEAPRIMRVMSRRLISVDAETLWRRQREMSPDAMATCIEGQQLTAASPTVRCSNRTVDHAQSPRAELRPMGYSNREVEDERVFEYHHSGRLRGP